jgi:hypothetical protein
MARKATIGPEVFRRVNELVAEGKRRSEAFVIVGQERGSSPGTVSANYYRVARAQTKGGQRRASATASPPAVASRTRTAPTTRRRPATSRARANGNGDIGQIAEQIAKLTKQLVRQIEERDRQIRALI